MKYMKDKKEFKKRPLSEDELLNVAGGMRAAGGLDNGECPNIKEKDECKKHDDGCLWNSGRCYKNR